MKTTIDLRGRHAFVRRAVYATARVAIKWALGPSFSLCRGARATLQALWRATNDPGLVAGARAARALGDPTRQETRQRDRHRLAPGPGPRRLCWRRRGAKLHAAAPVDACVAGTPPSSALVAPARVSRQPWRAAARLACAQVGVPRGGGQHLQGWTDRRAPADAHTAPPPLPLRIAAIGTQLRALRAFSALATRCGGMLND